MTDKPQRPASSPNVGTVPKRGPAEATSASYDRFPNFTQRSIKRPSILSISTSISSGDSSKTSLMTLDSTNLNLGPNLAFTKSIVPLEEIPEKTQCTTCGQPVVPEYTSNPSFLSVLLLTFCCPCVFCNCCSLQARYERQKKPVSICPECRTVLSDLPENFDPRGNR